MAMPKLIKVPINIYSVSFRSLVEVKSPNLNTDLAVIKKPTASQCPTMMNINTNRRSKIPIYFPASFKDSLSSVYFEISHFVKMVLIIIEVGVVKKAKQIINSNNEVLMNNEGTISS